MPSRTVCEIADIGAALTKDAGAKQRAKKDGIDAASPGDGRQPRRCGHSGLIVSSFGKEMLDCLGEMLLSRRGRRKYLQLEAT